MKRYHLILAALCLYLLYGIAWAGPQIYTGNVYNPSGVAVTGGTIDGTRMGASKTNVQKGPAAVTSFAGTISRSGTTLTFSSAADAVLAGYSATNPIVGTTVIHPTGPVTMYITAWLGSTSATVDSSGTLAAQTPTSVQLPIAVFVDSSGVVKGWMNAAGNNYWVGNQGIGTPTPGTLLELGDVNGVAGKGQLFINGLNSVNDGLYVDRTITNEYGWFNFQGGETTIGSRGGTSSHGYFKFVSYNGTDYVRRFSIAGSGTITMSAYGAGTATFDASGNISSVSDERLKNIQGAFTPGLSEVLGIDPILYKYKPETGLDTENVYAGFSAQNVMKYIPEAVGKNADGMYSFNDRAVVAALVNAVKELQSDNDDLRKALNLTVKDKKAKPVKGEEKIIKSKPKKVIEEVEIPASEAIIDKEYQEKVRDENGIPIVLSTTEKVSYILSNGVVVKKKDSIPTYQIETKTRKELKQGVRLDEKTGKFYEKREKK
jgi:hypothetical protein